MAVHGTKMAALLRLARGGPFRSRALEADHIPRAYLQRLLRDGKLERIDRGLYRWRDDEDPSDAVVAALIRVPSATLCLLSAAHFHGLLVRTPAAVWLMIGTHDRRPAFVRVPVELVRGKRLAEGQDVESHRFRFPAVTMRVTTPARTVADCFRYRRRVGLATATKVLGRFVRASNGAAAGWSLDALLEAAVACRVVSVILRHARPRLRATLESLMRGSEARARMTSADSS